MCGAAARAAVCGMQVAGCRGGGRAGAALCAGLRLGWAPAVGLLVLSLDLLHWGGGGSANCRQMAFCQRKQIKTAFSVGSVLRFWNYNCKEMFFGRLPSRTVLGRGVGLAGEAGGRDVLRCEKSVWVLVTDKRRRNRTGPCGEGSGGLRSFPGAVLGAGAGAVCAAPCLRPRCRTSPLAIP